MIQKLHDTGSILMILVSSFILLYGACGGKVVLEEGYSAGMGGSGGAGGAIINSASHSGAGAGNSAGTFASTGSVTPVPCARCAEFITNAQAPLCPDSEPIYKKLYACVCGGPCAMSCLDNYCANTGKITDSCAQCAVNACNDAFNACVNDL